jgi:hypothetical protein
MLQVWVGWDSREANAAYVCCESLLAHSSIPVELFPVSSEIAGIRAGMSRESHTVVDPMTGASQSIDAIDGKPFSTTFSFSRFAVPALANYREELVVFCDPDFLWRGDIADLIAEIDPDKAVSVVKHEHAPTDTHKMDGVAQTLYPRKNWSSLMVMRPDLCRELSARNLNTATGLWLHTLAWTSDDDIGAIPERWNWLCGHSDVSIDPAVVHFTNGTPDMPGHEGEAYAEEWWAILNNRRQPATT